jgi:hypothetical protein
VGSRRCSTGIGDATARPATRRARLRGRARRHRTGPTRSRGRPAGGVAADLIGVRTTPLVIGGAITALTTVIPLIPASRIPRSAPATQSAQHDASSPAAESATASRSSPGQPRQGGFSFGDPYNKRQQPGPRRACRTRHPNFRETESRSETRRSTSNGRVLTRRRRWEPPPAAFWPSHPPPRKGERR